MNAPRRCAGILTALTGAALLSAYRDWRGRWDGTPGARPVLDQRFDRRELTGRLATLLEGTRP